MRLTPGLKLRSAASTAQLIVIRAPGDEVEVTCAGAPLSTDDPGEVPPAGDGEQLLVGKRYGDADDTIELLCTAPGAGPLAVDGRPMAEQAAKALPSSD